MSSEKSVPNTLETLQTFGINPQSVLGLRAGMNIEPQEWVEKQEEIDILRISSVFDNAAGGGAQPCPEISQWTLLGHSERACKPFQCLVSIEVTSRANESKYR
jgi:hypothetical protein